MRTTILDFQAAKEEGRPLTMLTAYDYSTARLFDGAGVDALLVGDSLGMVMLGYEDTLSVTMDEMIHHTRAVARGAKEALVIGDMPFLSYQTGLAQAVANAGRFFAEARAQAVKLEGGAEVAPVIRAIVEAKMPVCAHIGLTPQAVHALGGFRVQGKRLAAARRLIDDALAVEAAGAFAVVLECVPAPLAAEITRRLRVPTIGIGAGVDCDGQVLVYQDMLGLYGEMAPRFVKRFADVGAVMREGVRAYIEAVQARRFPEAAHGFAMEESVLAALKGE